jgi:adenylate cyclase class IV
LRVQRPNREIEIKLRIVDLNALLDRLRRLGARRVSRVHERDTLFDTARREFFRRGAMFRVRTVVPAPPPGQNRRGKEASGSRSRRPEDGLLTYKGMLGDDSRRSSHARRGASPKYKIREEIEFHLASARRFERLLLRLGLRESFRYEKFRTQYRLKSAAGLHIDLDETPVGSFLELEGPKRDIDRIARMIGFRPEDYVTVSYLELYFDECRREGRKPSAMVFRAKKVRN